MANFAWLLPWACSEAWPWLKPRNTQMGVLDQSARLYQNQSGKPAKRSLIFDWMVLIGEYRLTEQRL